MSPSPSAAIQASPLVPVVAAGAPCSSGGEAPDTPKRSESPEGSEAAAGETKGFGGSGGRGRSRRSARRRPALSKADWGPLGKHPDLDAIVARQRLHLPLSGRLTTTEVNQAWKRCAAEHHPDRGGAHDTMQLVNTARDLLLGRDQLPATDATGPH
ncbi:MAG: J domain-containing protein [Cyanobacteriota bacterium]|nr:J domain-containing protein [Cyanobacteriota bacterium]